MNPRQFTDTEGDTWTLALNVAINRTLRDSLGVDLLNLDENKVYARLLTEPELLVDVLYVICRPQAEGRKVDDFGFASRLDGETLDQAAEALIGAIVDFFPRSRRQVMTAAMQRTQELLDKAADHQTRIIQDPRIEARIDQEMRKVATELLDTPTSGSRSTSLPES